MQIHSDIPGREIKVSNLANTSVVGSAILGAIAGGYFKSVQQAQQKICRFQKNFYLPREENKIIYEKLYQIYKQLHDSFGTPDYNKRLYNVMKDLLEIKKQVYGK